MVELNEMKKLWSVWIILFGVLLLFLPELLGPRGIENLFVKMPDMYFMFGLLMFLFFSGRIIILIGLIIFAFQIGKIISDRYYKK